MFTRMLSKPHKIGLKPKQENTFWGRCYYVQIILRSFPENSVNLYALMHCRIRTVISELSSKKDYLEITATLLNTCLRTKELLLNSSVL